MTKIDNHKQIVSLFLSGITGPHIGNRFGISRERVRQILNMYGIKKTDGGVFKQGQNTVKRNKEVWLNKFLKVWGCYRKDIIAIIGKDLLTYNKKCIMYRKHKNNSKNRGIMFNLSFPEWHKIWMESGKYESRGRSGYVMARHGDIGPYEIGNVKIILSSQNHKDAWIYKKWNTRRKNTLKS